MAMEISTSYNSYVIQNMTESSVTGSTYATDKSGKTLTINPKLLEKMQNDPEMEKEIPAQIKGVIDRIFSLVVGGKDIAGKKCILITCCEEDDMSVMDGVRIPIERMAALNKWEIAGEVLIPGVLNIGDIDKTDGCKKAADLAEAI